MALLCLIWEGLSTYSAVQIPGAGSSRSQGNLPYKFTGKELDPETGLYYFGARYYDPRVSVWVSVDPILTKYIGRDPKKLKNNGVFDSRNLSLYTYSYQNPITLFDPDGRAVFIVGGAADPARTEKSIVKNAAPSFTDNFSGVFKSEFAPQYFKHSEQGELQAAVLKMAEENPDEPIVLVGHSWGGASVTESQQALSEQGVDVDLLITVDPVSWIDGATGKKDGSKTKWVNLYPKDRNRFTLGDFVTIFGNAWNKEHDADINVEVDVPGEDGHVGIMYEKFDQSILNNPEKPNEN